MKFKQGDIVIITYPINTWNEENANDLNSEIGLVFENNYDEIYYVYHIYPLSNNKMTLTKWLISSKNMEKIDHINEKDFKNLDIHKVRA